jgi:dolichyl-phosphate-mannose--protein O-mannosyl transferase
MLICLVLFRVSVKPLTWNFEFLNKSIAFLKDSRFVPVLMPKSALAYFSCTIVIASTGIVITILSNWVIRNRNLNTTRSSPADLKMMSTSATSSFLQGSLF